MTTQSNLNPLSLKADRPRLSNNSTKAMLKPSLMFTQPQEKAKPKPRMTVTSYFSERGYYPLKKKFPGQETFNRLYSILDATLDQLEYDPYLFKRIKFIERQFNKSVDNQCYYSMGVKQKFHHGFIHKDESSKFSVQINLDFILYIERKFPELLVAFPILSQLNTEIKEMHRLASIEFFKVIKQLNKQYRGFTRRVLCNPRKPMPILFYIEKFTQGSSSAEQYAVEMHEDNSALTMIMNNTDFDAQNLIVSVNDKPEPVQKRISHRSISSTGIIFPGKMLKTIGIDIEPTPHAVKQFSQPFRYALVAYLIIPYACNE